MHMLDILLDQLEASRVLIFGINLGDKASQVLGRLGVLDSAIRTLGLFAAAIMPNMDDRQQPLHQETRVVELDSNSDDEAPALF